MAQIERSMRDIKEILLSRRIITNQGCWEYSMCRNRSGYGKLSFRGKLTTAHRLSYEVFKGAIGDYFVCHRCDNPPCFNPDHLFLGTHLDNIRDAKAKGVIFGRPLHGEEHGRHKLTLDQVISIRKAYKPFVKTMDMLAEEYGVCNQTIQKIIYGENWRFGKSKGER